MVTEYAAGSVQQMDTLDLGACYPVGKSVPIFAQISVSQVAVGYYKKWDFWVQEFPYVSGTPDGSDTGVHYLGRTGPLPNGSDDELGDNLTQVGIYGKHTLSLETVTRYLYLVVKPIVTHVSWWSNGNNTLNLDGSISGSVTCPGSEECLFVGTPLVGVAPLTVVFDDNSTNTPTAWLWDFGDGSTSTVQNPTHVYTEPGVYTVSLSVDGTPDLSCSQYAYVRAYEALQVIPTKSIAIDKSLRLIADQAEVTIANEDLPLGWGPNTTFPTNTRIRIYQWYGDD